MLEAVDDVQNKENPVNDDEDQVDFAFRVPDHDVARVRRSGEGFSEFRKTSCTGQAIGLFKTVGRIEEVGLMIYPRRRR